MGMETTLDIDPTLIRRARDEAARRGISVSELVADGLWRVLETEAAETDAPEPSVAEDDVNEGLPPPPNWKGGGFVAEVADREALQRAVATTDNDGALPPLPTWHGGGPPLVDVADRRKLYEVLDAD